MHSEEGNVRRGNQQLEIVDEYIHTQVKNVLGKENQTSEIQKRRRQSWAAFGKLSHILKNKNIALHHKRKAFEMCILPVICCGAENWTMTQKNLNKLRVTQRAMKRVMLGISLNHKRQRCNRKSDMVVCWACRTKQQ